MNTVIKHYPIKRISEDWLVIECDDFRGDFCNEGLKELFILPQTYRSLWVKISNKPFENSYEFKVGSMRHSISMKFNIKNSKGRTFSLVPLDSLLYLMPILLEDICEFVIDDRGMLNSSEKFHVGIVYE